MLRKHIFITACALFFTCGLLFDISRDQKKALRIGGKDEDKENEEEEEKTTNEIATLYPAFLRMNRNTDVSVYLFDLFIFNSSNDSSKNLSVHPIIFIDPQFVKYSKLL
mgnify:CR=1 FL=1